MWIEQEEELCLIYLVRVDSFETDGTRAALTEFIWPRMCGGNRCELEGENMNSILYTE